MKERILSVTADDCEMQTFRCGGKGGQKQNKTDSGVRFIHHPSGARGESREERSQLQNKKIAWRRMVESAKFRIWMNREIYQLDTGKTAEQRVEEDMHNRNLKVEVKDENGRWTDE